MLWESYFQKLTGLIIFLIFYQNILTLFEKYFEYFKVIFIVFQSYTFKLLVCNISTLNNKDMMVRVSKLSYYIDDILKTSYRFSDLFSLVSGPFINTFCNLWGRFLHCWRTFRPLSCSLKKFYAIAFPLIRYIIILVYSSRMSRFSHKNWLNGVLKWWKTKIALVNYHFSGS